MRAWQEKPWENYVTQTKKQEKKRKRANFKHSDVYAIEDFEVERYMLNNDNNNNKKIVTDISLNLMKNIKSQFQNF